MSYCRWSSDNWKSDVYVYGDCRGGITCHVAGNRIVGEVPAVPLIGSVPDDQWLAAHKAASDFVNKADHVHIGLPHDGETFNERDEGAMAARLLKLRKLGYNVPQHAIDALLEEAHASEPQSDQEAK